MISPTNVANIDVYAYRQDGNKARIFQDDNSVQAHEPESVESWVQETGYLKLEILRAKEYTRLLAWSTRDGALRKVFHKLEKKNA